MVPGGGKISPSHQHTYLLLCTFTLHVQHLLLFPCGGLTHHTTALHPPGGTSLHCLSGGELNATVCHVFFEIKEQRCCISETLSVMFCISIQLYKSSHIHRLVCTSTKMHTLTYTWPPEFESCLEKNHVCSRHTL